MDRPGFINLFAETLEIDDTSSLTPDTEFRLLDEWDSLAYLNIVAMIEEEYGLQISAPAFKRLTTLGDMMALIEASE